MPIGTVKPIPLIWPPPPSSGRTLAVTHVGSDEKEWCWAACAVMVADHFEIVTSQCELAGWLLSEYCCPPPAICNEACTIEEVSRVYAHMDIASSHTPRAVGFRTLRDQINAGCLVEVHYEWDRGGEHVAIIHGWGETSSQSLVRVADPWCGVGCADYDTGLIHAYGLGNWIGTWTDLHG